MEGSPEIITVEIGEDPPSRLDKALARDVPESISLSRTRLARLIEEGAVSLGGVPMKDLKAKVTEGDVLRIELPAAAESHIQPEPIPLEIIFEDAHLIVVNKPAGMVVHPAPGTPAGTLVNALLFHCGEDLSGVGGAKRPGVVHRIDKDTSGLLVVAKTDAAHQGLAAQFEAHSVERRYEALTFGTPSPADPRLGGLRGVTWRDGRLTIRTSLARHRTDRQKQAVVWERGRAAITHARVLETFGSGAASRVECRLETGRTHQIRVHMAYIGHGLIGDPVYGGRRSLSARLLGSDGARRAAAFSRQALHAASLGFVHPVTNETLRFEAPVPSDMASLIDALSAGTS